MKTWTFQRTVSPILAVGLLFVSTGCASLLPHQKNEAQIPWHSYAEAQAMFAKIVPGKTHLTDLKALAVDPDQTPNVAVLSHADLLRRLYPSTSYDTRLLDPGLQECVSARYDCFAYEIEQVSLNRQRFGSFWMDFFNFARQVRVTGWQFNAVVVVKGDVVVYKQWSGKPNVLQLEEERSPLGPIQSLGPSLFAR